MNRRRFLQQTGRGRRQSQSGGTFPWSGGARAGQAAVIETTNENSVFYFVRRDGLSPSCEHDELARDTARANARRIPDRCGETRQFAARIVQAKTLLR
jgi:hypothetical protein